MTEHDTRPTLNPDDLQEFRALRESEGLKYRFEVWSVMLAAAAVLLVFHSQFTASGTVGQVGPYFVIIVALPAVLRWLSSTRSPVRRWSAHLFIAAAYVDLLCLMVVRVTCLAAGVDAIPLIVPLTALLSLLVVQLRLPHLVIGMVGGLAIVVAFELSMVEITSNRLFDLVAGSGIVLVPIVAAFGAERVARAAWRDERELDRLTRTDGLTGLPNRRALIEHLCRIVDAPRSAGLTVAIIDIDQFKRFNDEFGHPAGDDCLRHIGAHLLGEIRPPQEFVARLSGEEFVVVARASADAVARIECLRRGIGELRIPAVPTGRVVTASAGVAEIVMPATDPHQAIDAVLKAADDALYVAKSEGRDRSVVGSAALHVVAGPPRSPRTEHTDVAASLETTWRHLRFGEPLESLFRLDSERSTRPLRRCIAIGILVFSALIFVFQGSLLKMPPEADLFGRMTLALGVAPPAVGALVATIAPRLQSRSEVVFVLAVGAILCAQMIERVVQTPKGYDVVPWLMPVSVLMSLCIIQIRYSLLLPAMTVYTLALTVTEVLAFPITGNRVLTVVTTVLMAAVALRFSYRVERSRRLAWLHARELDRLSRTDAVTKLPNRREFDRRLATASHCGEVVGVLILDVDHFKAYNDRFGHQAGDDCLRQVANALDRAAAGSDTLVARIGGEEFAAILIGPDVDALRDRARRIWRAVAGIALPAAATGSVVTASAGLAWSGMPDNTCRPGTQQQVALTDVVEDADRALYRAKHAGRNRFIESNSVGGGERSTTV